MSNQHVTRRRFLASSAAAGMSILTTQSPATASLPLPTLPIVDTHEHLWDPAGLAPPWLKSDSVLNGRYGPAEYAAATAGLNLVQSVYMEVAMDPAQHVAEAEYVIGLCKKRTTPLRAAVIGGRPGDAAFRDYILRFRGSPYVKGVREILKGASGGRDLVVPAGFVGGLRLLGELGMCFDLCCPAPTLSQALRLVDDCPGTRFVLDHCGNADVNAFRAGSKPSHDPDQWRRDMEQMARRKNVICKISGIIARVKPGWTPDDLAPIVNHCLDSFGPQRVVFASDWPVCTRGAALRDWVGALSAIVRKRPEAEQRMLFGENAIRFYGL